MMRTLFGLLTAGICIGFFSACAHRAPASTPADPYTALSSGDDDTVETADVSENPNLYRSRKAGRAYFDWPVDQARLTRGYLPNKHRPHLGVDLAASKGTPIFASHDGTILYTGRDFKGFGKMILIEGKQGWASLYGHLSKIDVREGQTVHQGDLIARMGSTGRSTGSHLHFEIRKGRGPVDPLLHLPGGPLMAGNK